MQILFTQENWIGIFIILYFYSLQMKLKYVFSKLIIIRMLNWLLNKKESISEIQSKLQSKKCLQWKKTLKGLKLVKQTFFVDKEYNKITPKNIFPVQNKIIINYLFRCKFFNCGNLFKGFTFFISEHIIKFIYDNNILNLYIMSLKTSKGVIDIFNFFILVMN